MRRWIAGLACLVGWHVRRAAVTTDRAVIHACTLCGHLWVTGR